MNEKEWATCNNNWAMRAWLAGQDASWLSQRTLRLWAIGCVRLAIGPRLNQVLRDCLLVAERDADDLAPGARLVQAWDEAGESGHRDRRIVQWACRPIIGIDDLGFGPLGAPPMNQGYSDLAAALLRDVVHDPFQRVRANAGGRMSETVSPDLLTRQVRDIAEGIYQANDMTSLGVLADALEEAGLEDGELLWHLQGCDGCPHCEGAGWVYPEPLSLTRQKCPHCDRDGLRTLKHIKGCWALDLCRGLTQ